MRKHIAPEVNTTSTTTTTITPYKFWPWLWPWVVPAVLLPLSGPAWLAWGQHRDFWPLVVLLVGPFGLAWFTRWVARARGESVRTHAAATVAACGLWFFLAALLSPAPMVGWWLFLVVGMGASWNIRRAMRGHGGDHTDGGGALAEAIGIARAQAIRVDGSKVRARVQVRPGDLVRNLKPANIASWLGVPVPGLRIVEDPDNPREGELTAVVRDLLADPTPWPGPSAPGGCITEPIVLGLRESGQPLQLWLPGNGRGRVGQNVLIAGMTQAGKSAAAELLCAEVATRRNARLDMLDVAKGSELGIGFAGHKQITVHAELADARAFIGALPSLVEDRGRRLAALGLKSWKPGIDDEELSWYRVVLVDEAATLILGSDPFARAIRICLSRGVSFIVIGQRATTDNVPSSVRRSCGTALQFGCIKEPRDADYALSEATMQAGAVPHHWKASKPGYLYAEVPGTDVRWWPEPCRTFLPGEGQIGAALGGTGKIVDHGGGDDDAAVMVEAAEFVPTGKAAPDEAKRMFLARVDELRAEGGEIRPADFDAMLRTAGRSKTWLDGALGKLVDARALERVRHGVYQFPDPARRR